MKFDNQKSKKHGSLEEIKTVRVIYKCSPNKAGTNPNSSWKI
jgi:hypothetical protein